MLARLLRAPRPLPAALGYSVLFYLGHLLCAGWVASAQIFLGLCVIASFIALRRGEFVIGAHPLYLPLVLYCAASTISMLLRPLPMHSFPDLGVFPYLAFPLALSFHRSVEGMLSLGRRTLAFLAIFLSMYGVVQFAVLGWSPDVLERRIRGSLSHVMTFSGVMLALGVFFAVWAAYLARNDGLRRRLGGVAFPAAAAVMATTAIILTFTRGAWIGWVAAIGVAVLRTRPRWMLGMVVLLLIAILVSPLPIFARLISIADIHQPSNLDRIRMLQGGAEIIKDYPFFGVGIGNVKEVYPLYRAEDAPRFRIPHLHNNLAQLWAERGVFVLIAYLWLVGGFMALCLRVGRDESGARLYADAGLAMAVGLTVAGLFEYNYGDSEVLHVAFALMALTIAGIERERRNALDGAAVQPAGA